MVCEALGEGEDLCALLVSVCTGAASKKRYQAHDTAYSVLSTGDGASYG